MVTINFYETSKPYGCFSNFSRHAVEFDGRTWATSEHFFQAAKFTDQADIEAIHNAKTPFSAAQLGRERGRSFRSTEPSTGTRKLTMTRISRCPMNGLLIGVRASR